MKCIWKWGVCLALLFGFAPATAGGQAHAAGKAEALDGAVVLAFKQPIEARTIYERLRLVDEKQQEIPLIISIVGEKKAIAVPMAKPSGAVTWRTDLAIQSVRPHVAPVALGTKANYDRYMKIAAKYARSSSPFVKYENGPAAVSEAKEDAAPQSHSETNVQTAGVDEADLVKSDGKRLFYLTGDGAIQIVQADGGAPAVLSTIRYLSGAFQPSELYLDGDRLIAIGSYAQVSPRSASPVSTKTVIFDVSDPRMPKAERVLDQEGYYVSSRKIGANVHVVTSHVAFAQQPDRPLDLPAFRDSERDGTRVVSPAKMMIYPFYPSASQLLISSADVRSSTPARIMSVTGSADTLYMSRDHLFISYEERRFHIMNRLDRPAVNIVAGEPRGAQETTIKRFAVRGLNVAYEAEAKIDGTVLNSFSMDEKDGYFRVAYSPQWASERQGSSLSVFDAQMRRVGHLDGIAPGERIYSARFLGDKGYMVTYKNVDPLFVIDLKNPAQPSILGYLKVPGYSQYLHPIGEDVLLGIGKDAYFNGKTAYYLGMKLALFDVSNPAQPSEKAVASIGDRGTESPVLYDHKALMVDRARGLYAFPLSEARVTGDPYRLDAYGMPPYGEPVLEGAAVYKIDSHAIRLLGKIEHSEVAGDRLGWDGRGAVERVVAVGNTIYTLSPQAVQATDIDTMRSFARVAFD